MKLLRWIKRVLRLRKTDRPQPTIQPSQPQETTMQPPPPQDFSLKMMRFERQVKEARREREQEWRLRAIAEKNVERQKSTLGYGLKSRNFKPRPSHEKRTFDIRKKPEEN